MRKFNLKENAARRMMDPEQQNTVSVQETVREAPVPGFSVVSRTDVGRVRKSNQDALVIGVVGLGVLDHRVIGLIGPGQDGSGQHDEGQKKG